MKMHNRNILLTFSLAHFIVDLSSAILLYCFIFKIAKNSNDIIIITLLYNFFAFAFELPIGSISDKIKQSFLVSAIGCALVIFALIIKNNLFISAIICGIGNAMFHIGGGIEVLKRADKKATDVGIFVSTGSLGIFFGRLLSNKNLNISLIIIPITLLLFMIMFLSFENKNYNVIKANPETFDFSNKNINCIILCIILLSITVFFRSFIGFMININPNNIFIYSVIIAIAVFLGKFLGGIIADRFGLLNTALFSLIFSNLCFIFNKNILIASFGLLLFNMSMPITLITISNLCKDNYGLAFGITTLMLFDGFIPFLFFNIPSNFAIIILLIAIKCLLLILSISIYEKVK